jgi:hypothetical protein
MKHFEYYSSGLYYKHMMIVNENSRVVNKLEALLIDDARVIIYDRHMFIVQPTDVYTFHRRMLAFTSPIEMTQLQSCST